MFSSMEALQRKSASHPSSPAADPSLCKKPNSSFKWFLLTQKQLRNFLFLASGHKSLQQLADDVAAVFLLGREKPTFAALSLYGSAPCFHSSPQADLRL